MTSLATPDDVQETFRRATSLHRDGNLQMAERAYRQVIAADPRHFRTLCSLSLLRAQQGAHQEAALMLRHAGMVAGQDAGAHVLVGDLFVRIGQIELATEQYRRAIDLHPAHRTAHHHLANALFRLGRVEAAIEAYQATVAADPDSAEAHHNLAVALQRAAQPAEAVVHYERALALKPDLSAAHAGLADACRAIGQLQAAAAHYRRALAIAPRQADIHGNLGGVLQQLGETDEAIASYRTALSINPKFAQAHYNLANLLQARGEIAQAVRHYGQAIEAAPDFAEAHNNLGTALQKLRRFDAAIAHYQRVIALRPDGVSARQNLGNALHAAGRSDEAISHYAAVLAAQPDNISALDDLAAACLVTGRLDDATRAYEKATALAPENMRVALNFARARPFSADDPRLDRLVALTEREASLPEDDRIALHFTLGKAYADIGDPARSFTHLATANRLKRQLVAYDERDVLGRFYRICKTFSPELMRAKTAADHAATTPIFIVGMPRSGTTLIEQLMASHPYVHGAGEIRDLADVVSEFSAQPQLGTPFPEVVAAMSARALGELGVAYAERIASLAPRAACIVDKMPANFAYIGLIHLALPNARIIHARRDPFDTCLSCFSVPFSEGHPYVYDLRELGRYYRGYDALMRHWRAVLPKDRMLDVAYEEVVADLEGQARRIIGYCGLDWHDDCLKFCRTRRPVQTTSAMQVPQPIHHGSAGHWRAYGRLLDPLLHELDPSY